MSGKLAGEAKVTKNGTLLRLLPEVEVDLGGLEREVHAGGCGVINGFTEKTVAPLITAKAQLAAGEKLSDLTFEDATVIVTFNTGQQMIFRNAFTTKTPKWTGGKGEVAMEISSTSMPEEV